MSVESSNSSVERSAKPPDNLLRSLDYAVLQQCMHCGMCLPTCPTYDETLVERNSPRGRISLMRAIADGKLEATETFAREMYYCLGCLACKTACPAGVDYPQLFETARAEVERAGVLDKSPHEHQRNEETILETTVAPQVIQVRIEARVKPTALDALRPASAKGVDLDIGKHVFVPIQGMAQRTHARMIGGGHDPQSGVRGIRRVDGDPVPATRFQRLHEQGPQITTQEAVEMPSDAVPEAAQRRQVRGFGLLSEQSRQPRPGAFEGFGRFPLELSPAALRRLIRRDPRIA